MRLTTTTQPTSEPVTKDEAKKHLRLATTTAEVTASTKKIQLTIGGGAAGAGKVADITVLWRPLVAGGYYLNA